MKPDQWIFPNFNFNSSLLIISRTMRTRFRIPKQFGRCSSSKTDEDESKSGVQIWRDLDATSQFLGRVSLKVGAEPGGSDV
jgi:hypothetical protein